jgi:hypothetical protein
MRRLATPAGMCGHSYRCRHSARICRGAVSRRAPSPFFKGMFMNNIIYIIGLIVVIIAILSFFGLR